MRRTTAGALGAGLTVALIVAACGAGGGSDDAPPSAASSSPSSSPSTDPSADPGADPSADPSSDPSQEPAGGALDAALSEPVEDPVYPEVGDPGVDALRYDLRLNWTPQSRRLRSTEVLTFRATTSADTFRLDLAAPLEVTEARVDGRTVQVRHEGKELVVEHPVEADGRYVLRLDYAGSPEPVPAPTTRSDVEALGWTTTPQGAVWTMQEPYGAFTWYAVNDQPSDKAFYEVRITSGGGLVGVSNGTLAARQVGPSGGTTTRWVLDEPTASYLVTVAIDDYTVTEDTSDSGVPLSYWVPRDRQGLLPRLRRLPDALGWVEERLGDYPFDSLGIVLVDSRSGMESQTMLTLGATSYATSPEVLVHEVVHQWYGDLVTPRDWRDVWMNEGMATYLQGVWQSEQDDTDLGELMDRWAVAELQQRAEAGPPGAYDRAAFGESNIYYGPALMWDELRRQVGDEEFFALVRDWPRVDADGTVSRDDYLPWIEEQTGLDLGDFFDAWLLGTASPERGSA